MTDEWQENLMNIFHKFCAFTDGVRVLMLIDRGVKNSNKGSKRWINKIITTNSQEWFVALQRLMEMQRYIDDPAIRLYCSLNDRNLDKAISHFKHAQIDVTEDMKNRFYCKINDTFASCLMKTENKQSKYFLLDVDTLDKTEVNEFVKENNVEVVFSYATKKGFHYIVKPFNVTLAENKQTFVVNKDGLLLINYLEEEPKE